MSLSTEEREAMMNILRGKVCHVCGSELVPHDDGVTPTWANEWGIAGAYVTCDFSDHEVSPEDIGLASKPIARRRPKA